MKNIRKISKTAAAKPIKYILICSICFGYHLSFSQNSYEEEIQKHREAYKADFIKEENSPLKKEDLAYLDFYKPDEKYKVLCKFRADGDGTPFEIPTSNGKTKTYSKFGQLTFKINGKRQKLSVYRSLALMNNPLYKDYLFIPFKDATSGNTTYGGGRYLDLRMGEFDDDKIVLDFNKAYNPYCAFSMGYSCPIPPEENHLDIMIEAGEKTFKLPHSE